MHIYETPFYYIDYCLAQTAALQFLLESRKDYADAFARYVRFLSQGISQSQKRLIQAAGICSPGLTSAPAVAQLVVSLLEEAGLRSPFQAGALQAVAQESEALLRQLETKLDQP